MCCYINCIFHKRSRVSTLFISRKAKHFVIKVSGCAHNEGFKRRLSLSFIIIISAYNNFVLQLKVLLLIRVETAIKKWRLTIAINQDYSKEYSKFSRSLLSVDVDSLLRKHLQYVHIHVTLYNNLPAQWIIKIKFAPLGSPLRSSQVHIKTTSFCESSEAVKSTLRFTMGKRFDHSCFDHSCFEYA